MGLHTAQLVKHCSALSAELALLVQILSKSINLLFFTWNLQLLKYCCYCMRWLHPHLNLLLNWHMGKELSSVMIWLKKKAVDEKPLNFCKWSFSLSNSRFSLFFDTLLDSTKVCDGKQKYIYRPEGELLKSWVHGCLIQTCFVSHLQPVLVGQYFIICKPEMSTLKNRNELTSEVADTQRNFY